MAISYLENLKKQFNPFQSLIPYGKGDWNVAGINIPEFGRTEMIGGNTGSIDRAISGGNVAGASDQDTTPNVDPYNGGANQNVPVPEGFYNKSTNTGGQTTDNATKTMTGLAKDSQQSAIDAIKSRLGMIRDVANRQIGIAGNVRDEIKNNIATTYGGLKTSAQQKVGTALENLAQERTGVYDLYGTAKGEARRALESAMTKNRMLARAMGRLNSSFYDDRQAEATETGARNIGGLAREEAGKVAGIGTRETETKNWGEQTALQIDQEQAQLTSQADQEYQQKVNEALDMERAFGIDSVDQLQQAEIEYKSKLEAINQYVENKSLRVAEILAQAGQLGSGINSFEAIDPELENVLNNKTAYDTAKNTEIQTFNPVASSDMSYLPYYNQGQNTNSLDELYKRLGLRRFV